MLPIEYLADIVYDQTNVVIILWTVYLSELLKIERWEYWYLVIETGSEETKAKEYGMFRE